MSTHACLALLLLLLVLTGCAESAARNAPADTSPPATVVADPFADAYHADFAIAAPAIAALGEQATPAAADALLGIARQDIEPRLGAARAALVIAAERALARGDRELAASWAIHIYLSSTPHHLRRRALIAYARGAGEGSLDRLEHIVDGRLDARFLDDLPALLAEIPGARARDLERRLARRQAAEPQSENP